MSEIAYKINYSPEEIKSKFPITSNQQQQIKKQRDIIKKIISGEDPRKLFVIGPCSIDFESTVFEYAMFLRELYDKVRDKIYFVMRFNTTKPRTKIGWKGIVFGDPNQKEIDINNQLQFARNLALKITNLGIPISDELLYPEIFEYFEDIISYTTIGARSNEDQLHRELASGLRTPVGVKNPTSGSIKTMIESIHTIQNSHLYVFQGTVYKSIGNKRCHGILRGGNAGSNYGYDFLKEYVDMSKNLGINDNGVLIDFSHGNSGGKYEIQNYIMDEIFDNIIPALEKDGINASNLIKGFMIESYLFDGSQELGSKMMKGVSFTDPCIGIEKTEEFIMKLYNKIKI